MCARIRKDSDSVSECVRERDSDRVWVQERETDRQTDTVYVCVKCDEKQSVSSNEIGRAHV